MQQLDLRAKVKQVTFKGQPMRTFFFHDGVGIEVRHGDEFYYYEGLQRLVIVDEVGAEVDYIDQVTIDELKRSARHEA